MTAESCPADMLRALPADSISRPPVKPLYVASLWVVTALCLAMPVLYVGLIAAFGWLEFRYYTDWVHHVQPGFSWGRLMAWTVPGFVGGILILFLLKPLFAPRHAASDEIELTADDDPALVAGIHALCHAIGTRAPSSAELITDWLDTVVADADDSIRYRDAGMAPPKDPWEIDALAMGRVIEALNALRMNDPDRLGDWFGRFITLYRAGAAFTCTSVDTESRES